MCKPTIDNNTTTTNSTNRQFDGKNLSNNDINMTLLPNSQRRKTCKDDYKNELIREVGHDTLLHSPSLGYSQSAEQVLTPGKITLLYFSAYWCGRTSFHRSVEDSRDRSNPHQFSQCSFSTNSMQKNDTATQRMAPHNQSPT